MFLLYKSYGLFENTLCELVCPMNFLDTKININMINTHNNEHDIIVFLSVRKFTKLIMNPRAVLFIVSSVFDSPFDLGSCSIICYNIL